MFRKPRASRGDGSYERRLLRFVAPERLIIDDSRSSRCSPRPVPAVRYAGFVVRSGDFEVEVGSDFDEAALIRLLRRVRAC